MSASRARAAAAIAAGLSSDERRELLATMIVSADRRELAAVAVAWFGALDVLAKHDPLAAGELARAAWDHLAAHRPESPAPLDANFTPTEAARDPREARR